MVLWLLLVYCPCPEVSTKDCVLGLVLFNTLASDMEEQREGPVVRFSDNELEGSNWPAVQRGLLNLGKRLTEGS